MLFGILTLLTALSIAGVAAWFSIVGLMAIFSGAALGTAVMAGTLEVGKLVTASWLYRNWNVTAWPLKLYLSSAMVVLVLITSMGIFGYLSKAHIEKTAISGNKALQVEILDASIRREERAIKDSEEVISQLDGAVATLTKFERIRGNDGAIAVRKGQKEEREQLNAVITESSAKLATLQEQRAALRSDQLAMEVEVGPIKYIAEMIYGDRAASFFDSAVRTVIMILIFVFDPLAIALLLAANQSLLRHGVRLETQYVNPPASPTPIPPGSNDIAAPVIDVPVAPDPDPPIDPIPEPPKAHIGDDTAKSLKWFREAKKKP